MPSDDPYGQLAQAAVRAINEAWNLAKESRREELAGLQSTLAAAEKELRTLATQRGVRYEDHLQHPLIKVIAVLRDLLHTALRESGSPKEVGRKTVAALGSLARLLGIPASDLAGAKDLQGLGRSIQAVHDKWLERKVGGPGSPSAKGAPQPHEAQAVPASRPSAREARRNLREALDAIFQVAQHDARRRDGAHRPERGRVEDEDDPEALLARLGELNGALAGARGGFLAGFLDLAMDGLRGVIEDSEANMGIALESFRLLKVEFPEPQLAGLAEAAAQLADSVEGASAADFEVKRSGLLDRIFAEYKDWFSDTEPEAAAQGGSPQGGASSERAATGPELKGIHAEVSSLLGRLAARGSSGQAGALSPETLEAVEGMKGSLRGMKASVANDVFRDLDLACRATGRELAQEFVLRAREKVLEGARHTREAAADGSWAGGPLTARMKLKTKFEANRIKGEGGAIHEFEASVQELAGALIGEVGKEATAQQIVGLFEEFVEGIELNSAKVEALKDKKATATLIRGHQTNLDELRNCLKETLAAHKERFSEVPGLQEKIEPMANRALGK